MLQFVSQKHVKFVTSCVISAFYFVTYQKLSHSYNVTIINALPLSKGCKSKSFIKKIYFHVFLFFFLFFFCFFFLFSNFIIFYRINACVLIYTTFIEESTIQFQYFSCSSVQWFHLIYSLDYNSNTVSSNR